ncbi:hypothetical protein GGR52DRAFT_591309 [Hypoxylon sp. FL1284]|nr:hypothetical protein GGR52DRAFT_591309 [Hypoxylon sp. FL1284]
MARSNPPAAAIVCAENIAALHVLHSRPNQQNAVPAQPTSNPVTSTQSRSADYILPFSKERILAGTLAFLAYAKEDNNYIPAVCIEEKPKAGYLNVLLAVNKATENDGEDVLQESKKRLEGIFIILAQMDDDNPRNIEKNVFTAIVDMCSKRILHRLSLKRSKRTSQRQSIKGTLQTVLDCLKHIEPSSSKDLQSTSRLFTERAKEVIALVDAWTGHQVSQRLEALVDGIHRLREVGGLDALLSGVRDRDMHPHSRRSLANMIRKVARYREAARILHRLARRFPPVRRTRVEPVRLPAKAFERVPSGGAYQPVLQATLAAVAGGLEKKERSQLANVWRLLGGSNPSTEQKAVQVRFASRARETLRKSRIHAEVQLLYHMRQRAAAAAAAAAAPADTRRPRVVCSSKDACWLCSEFAALADRRVHVPRSHGRLYAGWRLPSLRGPGLDDVAARFNRRLQDVLRNSLRQLLAKRERTVYGDPVESTLLTYVWSASTLVSRPPASAEGKVEGGTRVGGLNPKKGGTRSLEVVDGEVGEEVPVDPESASPDAVPEEISTSCTRQGSPYIVPPIKHSSPAPESEAGSLRSRASSDADEDDRPPKRPETQHRKIKQGKTSSLRAATGLLEIQVEYVSSEPKAPSSRRKRLAYAVEALTAEAARALQERGEVPIIDATTLGRAETDCRTGKDGSLYLASGDAVVRVWMEPVVSVTGEMVARPGLLSI